MGVPARERLAGGELVWLRWPNVDLVAQQARIIEFATRLGWDLVASPGKSASAVRSVDLDEHLVAVLRQQRELQRFEARAKNYAETDFVFTMPRAARGTRPLCRRRSRNGLKRQGYPGSRRTG